MSQRLVKEFQQFAQRHGQILARQLEDEILKKICSRGGDEESAADTSSDGSAESQETELEIVSSTDSAASNAPSLGSRLVNEVNEFAQKHGQLMAEKLEVSIIRIIQTRDASYREEADENTSSATDSSCDSESDDAGSADEHETQKQRREDTSAVHEDPPRKKRRL